MALERRTPTPIRPGVEIAPLTPSHPPIEQYAEALFNITQTIIELGATGDPNLVSDGIEQAIRGSGLPPERAGEAIEAFTEFTNAFLEPAGPRIIQRPRLSIVPRPEASEKE